ncbi:O-antigen ligase family protein [Salinicoccus sp. HZC-1]|uniref:O-antigen ligase family protein n=1 Tax=Salinicoccus sp. HZC-1 TaxID=3385497 RepID=UPI00398BBC3A
MLSGFFGIYLIFGSVNGDYFDIINMFYYFSCAFIFVLALAGNISNTNMKNIQFTTILSLIFTSLISINDWIFSHSMVTADNYFYRAEGIYDNPNLLAQNLLLLLPIAFNYIKKQKFYSFIAISLFIITLIISQSRGTILTSLIILILFLFGDKYFSNRLKWPLSIFILVIAYMILINLGDDYLIRFKLTDDFSNLRVEALLLGIKSFSTSLFGIGIGNTSENLLSLSSHNIYIHILSEIGVVGLFILLIILFWLLKTWIRAIIRDLKFTYYLIPIILMTGFFTHNLLTNLVFYLILTIIVFENSTLKEVENEK